MYKNVYFIGIGGIGMSAIARYYKFLGYGVAGYDRTPSTLTAKLQEEGMDIHYTDSPELIPLNADETLVVYTPAIPSDLKELKYVLKNGYHVIKRSRMLGEITEGMKCLAVAGTHGKTTTSTLTAHILTESGQLCSAFLGGISKNYGTNMLMSHGRNVVVEADEFDRSFLQLHPLMSVITAMDADHLDIYGDLEHVHQAFRQYASQVQDTLILKYGLPISRDDTSARILTYHMENPSADYHATNMTVDECGHYTYDLVTPNGTVHDIRVGCPGWVNVENSVAAAAMCLCFGVNPEAVRNAIGTFTGVRRRMDVHVSSGKLIYLDDYAHHPNELSTAISSIRQMMPGRKITAVFQPHLFTRTRDFADEFAEALSAVDKLILLDIYPAREEPIPGVTSGIIFDKVRSAQKVMLSKDELLAYIEKEDIDILVTFGAGDIERLVEPISGLLAKRI